MSRFPFGVKRVPQLAAVPAAHAQPQTVAGGGQSLRPLPRRARRGATQPGRGVRLRQQAPGTSDAVSPGRMSHGLRQGDGPAAVHEHLARGAGG